MNRRTRMRNPLHAVFDAVAVRLLKFRARLIVSHIDKGATVHEVAETTSLTEDEIERILWWHRSQQGEVNGGWLS